MKRSIYIFMISALYHFTYGQEISGRVLDKTDQQPLENVSIYNASSQTGTSSMADGSYTLPLSQQLKDTDSLSFSLLGYETKRYSILQLRNMGGKVYLIPKTEQLHGVTVISASAASSNIAFTKLADMPKGVYHFGSIVHENKLYVVDGESSRLENSAGQLGHVNSFSGTRANFSWDNYEGHLQVYDFGSNSWTLSKNKFQDRAYCNAHQYQGKIYIIGGKTLSKNRKLEYLDDGIDIFNIAKGSLISDGTNPHQAVNFASTVYKDNLIVMGGSIKKRADDSKIYTNTAHLYNFSTGLWYQLPKMTSSKEVNGIRVRDTLYLIGGVKKRPLDQIEAYNITSGKWSSSGTLFFPMGRPALVEHYGTIYIFENRRIMTFNTLNHKLKAYTIDLPLHGAQMAYHDNQLFIIGGYTNIDFTQKPSNGLYAIDISQFEHSKTIGYKVLK